MAPSLVQSKTGNFSAATGTVTLTSNTTAGNCLIVCFGLDGTVANPVVSGVTIGGSADNFAAAVATNPHEGAAIWADANCAGGQTAVAFTTGSGSGTLTVAVTVMEWSGLQFPATVDQVNSNNSASSGTWTTNATPTTLQASEVIIGTVFSFHSGGTTITPPGAPWNNIAGSVGGNFIQETGWQVAAATGAFTYNGSFGAASGYGAAIATFRAGGIFPVASVLATWTSGGYGRNPLGYTPGPPALTPLAVSVTNTLGNWMFAFVSWRQDAGTAGAVIFPSTVSVSDDAGNFWIPVGVSSPAPGQSTTPATSIVRCAIWMAPAARPCELVFISPTGYQAALTVMITEFSALSPWYQIQVRSAGFTNQGTSLSLAQNAGANVLTLGMLTWDNPFHATAPTLTASGFTSGLPTAFASAGINQFGDMEQAAWYGTGTGTPVQLTANGGSQDYSALIVTISGVTDARAYPYGTPTVENWPVVITEIASGPTINADPTIAQGTTFWTGDAGTLVAGVSWPLFQPFPTPYEVQLFGSLRVTPTGSGGAFATAHSDIQAVNVNTLYGGLAYVYSPAGFGNGTTEGAACGIWWLDGGGGFLSAAAPSTVTKLQPGEWTQLVLPQSQPDKAAVQARLVIYEQGAGTNVAATAAFYIGYGALTVADSYQFTPPDQLVWTDISGRVFTQGQIQIGRGIQYEQQSLEAGTMTVYTDNHDGAFNFGNVQSVYWPTTGDTDVPIRVRAIWPGSLTPYAPLFSGYTDQITYGVDPDTYWGFAEIQASDAWSRLTQQMLALVEQEALVDSPVAFMSCSQNGANVIQTGSFTAALTSILSSIGNQIITTQPTATFTGGGIAIPGAAGLSCWQSGGTRAATTNALGTAGYCLAWLLQTPLTLTSLGLTFEWWWSPVSVQSSQSANYVIVGGTLASENQFVWLILADNTSPTASYEGYLKLQTFDVNGNQVSFVNIGTQITPYSTTSTASAAYYFSVSWTQTSITAVINPGDPLNTETVTLTGQNFSPNVTGTLWGGGLGIHGNFGDTAIADIAVFPYAAPPARTGSRYFAGINAFVGESDTFRLARVTGYSGFIPVLGMRGLDLPVPPADDVDQVTGATDTNTQVVSAYFSNVAASTLAAMFVNGAGTLIYRRRLEWYNRPIAQYVLGESDGQALSLGVNPLSTSPSTVGWLAENNATLTSSSIAAGGWPFSAFAGLFHGNGVTATPQIAYGRAGPGINNPQVTAGGFYTASCWVYSPQGWASGMSLQILWYSGGSSLSGTVIYTLPSLPAGSVAYMTVSGRAPAQVGLPADNASILVNAVGTPASSVQFYVSGVTLSQVLPDNAAGASVAVPEAPYMPAFQTSSDRAQQFNYAVLTQYGTNLVSSFSGTSVLFTPSSGVIVIIGNQPSIAQRGQIPYTATVYINNTVQAPATFLPGEGSIEDEANWIVQTLGSPLLRPDKVTLTPVATPSATTTGLFAEVGDTVMFRRRQFGAPEVQILCYISKITHNIDISSGTWTTAYELSPFPGGTILTADDVLHGTLTGQNLLGW